MPQPHPPFEIVQCITGEHSGRIGLRTQQYVLFSDDSDFQYRDTIGRAANYRVILSTSDLLALINSIVQELPPVAPPERPAPPQGGLHGWVDTSDGQALWVVPTDVMHAQALLNRVEAERRPMRNTFREALNDMIRLARNP